MDLQSKRRLVGASIWLALLVIVVPGWYSNPVNFSPDGKVEEEVKSSLPIVKHAYRLPVDSETPVADHQVAPLKPEKQQQASDVTENKAEEKSDEPLKPQFMDKVSGDSRYEGQWIVRLQAFNNTKQANELASKIEEDYPVYIKFFENTQVYSVRAGPYNSRSKAEKAKQKLDKILRTNGEVRQLPKTS